MENEMHEILWDSDIPRDHLIPTRRPNFVIITKKKKKTWFIVDFAVPVDHSENKKKLNEDRQVLRPCQRSENVWNISVTGISAVIGDHGTVPKGLETELE